MNEESSKKLKTLIITEKPSVARDYAKILNVSGRQNGFIENGEYVITWCVGHLVEMCYPEKYDEKLKKWNLRDLPFLPETYKYEVIGNVKKQYEIVNNMLHREDIGTVLWAGDSGREGQVIEELVRRYGGVRDGMDEKRIWIDSTTEEEISRGIREAKPYSEYDNLGNAGIMRGIEDYAMGINFSRALSVRYAGMLNDAAGTKKYAAIAVGRVMTCVLGMVVRREREIRNFKETVFYRLIGTFTLPDGQYTGEWKAVEGSAYFGSPKIYNEKGFLEEEDAKKLIETLQAEDHATILSVNRSQEKKKPPLLYNLAELQAACSKRFKISPEQTLAAAQELYEKKLTTYPRTDARVLSSAVAKEITKNLKGVLKYPPTAEYTKNILDNKLYTNVNKKPYTDDSKVTDHYAIIPTGNVSEYNNVSDLCKRVYDMIVRRFLSIFYPPAVFQKISLETLVGTEHFFTNSKVLKEPGFYVITGQDKKILAKQEKAKKAQDEDKAEKTENPDDDSDEEEEENEVDLTAIAGELKKNLEVGIAGFNMKNGKTTPPKRYTSGSMVLAMENAGQLIEDEELRAQIKGAGIGTSATRAGIIEKLIKIGYLNSKKQTLTPGRFGEMVYEVVYLTMPGMLNPEMTASWEKGLAGVERGEISTNEYRAKLDKYVAKYVEKVRSQDLSFVIRQKIREIPK